jgi:hypothetical protein
MLQIPVTGTLTVGEPDGSAVCHVRLGFVDPANSVELSDDQWRFVEGTLAQETKRHCAAYERRPYPPDFRPLLRRPLPGDLGPVRYLAMYQVAGAGL